MTLAVFLAVVMAAAVLSGQFAGGDWYRSMQQPAWNPSAAVMAMVWPLLYLLMALSAWMVWEKGRQSARTALAWWVAQLLSGICWSWIYFGQGRIGWALGVMTLWLLLALIMTNAFRYISRTGAWLCLPLVAWMIFSWYLNLIQWHLNGGGSG